MSPSSPPVIARRRIRRPPRRFRGRNRPPKRVAISTVVMMAIRARMPAIRYALVVTAVWLIATGTYFAFRDDVLTRLIGEQTELQSVYEDRIAKLRAQVDRIMSQKLLDQEQVEQRVNALLQRQARISLSLDKVEQKQAATLTDVEEAYRHASASDAQRAEPNSELTSAAQRPKEQLAGRLFRSCRRNRPLAPSKLNSIASMWDARRSTATARRWSQSQYANL